MMRGPIVKVLIFTMITGGIILYIGSQIAKTNIGGRYGLVATFDDATGLTPNDDVKLAGIVVGKVKSIAVKDGRAEISFQVNKDVKLPVDSSAAVRWRNLIGQRYVYLYPGESTKMLGGGDRIRRTTAVIDFGRLVNNLGPVADVLDANQLNEVVTALSQALDGNEDNLDSLFSNLSSVLRTLAERDATIGRLIGDYEKVTDALARRDVQIQTMVDNIVLLSQTFADNSGVLDDALVELSGMTSGLDVLLTRNADELARIISNVGVLAKAASTRIDSLESALVAIPEADRRLFSTTADGEFIKTHVVCLDPNPPPTCPHDVIVPDDSDGPERRSRSTAVLQRGPGRLDRLEAFDRLLVGFDR